MLKLIIINLWLIAGISVASYAQTDATTRADSIPLPVLIPGSMIVYDSIADIARDTNRTELFLRCDDTRFSDILKWGMQPPYSRVIDVWGWFAPFYANYPRITRLTHLKTLMLPARVDANAMLCDSLHLLPNLEQLEWLSDSIDLPTHTRWLKPMPKMRSLAIRTRLFPMEIFDLPNLNFLDLYVQDTQLISQGRAMPNLKTLVLRDSTLIPILNYCTRLEELVYEIPEPLAFRVAPITQTYIGDLRNYIRSRPTLHTVSLQTQCNFSRILPTPQRTPNLQDIERDILAKKFPYYRPLPAPRIHHVQRLYYSLDSKNGVMTTLFDTPESRELIHTIGLSEIRIGSSILRSLLDFPNIETLALFGFSIDETGLVEFFRMHQQHFRHLRELYLPQYQNNQISTDAQAKLQAILPRVKIIFYNYYFF